MPNSIGHHAANGHLPCDRCIGKQYNICHLLEPARQRELLDTSCRHRWDKREYLFRAGSPVGAVVNRNNDVAEEMRRGLAERLKMVGTHLSVVGQLTSTERVANFVAMMTAAYAARNVQTRPLPLPMKRSDIADYLGLRLETVSRAFSKLRQRSIIDINEDEVLILDQAKLNQLSNR
jgi:hypothetical protein